MYPLNVPLSGVNLHRQQIDVLKSLISAGEVGMGRASVAKLANAACSLRLGLSVDHLQHFLPLTHTEQTRFRFPNSFRGVTVLVHHLAILPLTRSNRTSLEIA